MPRPVKFSAHNHFRTSSKWNKNDFNKIINIITKRLDPGAVVGLTNFSDTRYEDFINLPSAYDRTNLGNAIYIPAKNILIVKGQEVPTKQGHTVAFGLEQGKHIKEGRTIEDTLKEIKGYGALTDLDHPFYRDGCGPYFEKNLDLLAEVDMIETHNGEAALWIPKVTPRNANPKARAFYEKNKSQFQELAPINVDDGHSFHELGGNWVALEMPEDYSTLNVNQTIKAALLEFRKDEDHGLYHTRGDEDLRLGALTHMIALSPYMALGLGKKVLSKAGIKL